MPSRSIDLLRTLRTRFGHPGFRPGQRELVEAALAGRDALGLLPTGGGKSLTYLLPAHHLPGMVLVVSPLIALMTDQLQRARACGLRAEALAGARTRAQVDSVLARIRTGTLDLLLTAPERLEEGSPLSSALAATRVSLLVVDEAHCLIRWGYDFRPSYRRLEGLAARLGGVPTLALTATATPSVRRALVRTLPLQRPVRVELSFLRPNLDFRVREVATEQERWARLWGLLRSRSGPALVYGSTRGMVERLAAALRVRGRRVEPFHAGMSPEHRAGIQERYLGGELDLITATCAFGMGVDKPDVRRVIHWSPPDSLEAYYQEAGRAGRDGEAAEVTLLWAPGDLPPLRSRLDRAFPTPASLWRAARRPSSGGVGEVALERFRRAGAGGRALVEAGRARRSAFHRFRAVRRYLNAPKPLSLLLNYLGEPG